MKKTPKDKKVLTVQLQKLEGASWYPRKMIFEPRQSEVEFGEVRDEWFLQVCNLAVQTAVGRKVEKSLVVKVGGANSLARRFYDRVRQPSGWLLDFFAESIEAFSKLVKSMAPGGEWLVWIESGIDIKLQKVDGEGNFIGSIEDENILELVSSDVSALYEGYKTKFKIAHRPERAVFHRDFDVISDQAFLRNGDDVRIEFETDVSSDLIIFVVSECGVISVCPELEGRLKGYGLKPGLFERKKLKSEFSFPPNEEFFKVVIERHPYIFLAVSLYGDGAFFEDQEKLDIRSGLEQMRSNLLNLPEIETSAAYDLQRVRRRFEDLGCVDSLKWLTPICEALPSRINYAKMVVAASG